MMEPKIQEQAAWGHLQHVYLQHLKQIKVKKIKNKGGDKVDQSGPYYQKCNLLEQHTSHLYIYIKENH